MDIRWLQDFLALAEMRNFTRAAEVRAILHTAFSRRIQWQHALPVTLAAKAGHVQPSTLEPVIMLNIL